MPEVTQERDPQVLELYTELQSTDKYDPPISPNVLRKRRSCELVQTPSPCVKKALFQLEKLKGVLLTKDNCNDFQTIPEDNIPIEGIKHVKNRKHLRFASPQVSQDDGEESEVSFKTDMQLSVKGIGGHISNHEVTSALSKKKYDLTPGEIFSQVEDLVNRLEEDRLHTLSMLKIEKQRVKDLGKLIDEMNIRRMLQLPLAVQKGHDACAADISELQWHVGYTKRELNRSKGRVEVAKVLNTRLKEDIDFVKKHCPLVEEKLLLEKEAMSKIRQLQKQTNEELKDARNALDEAERKYKEACNLAEEEREATRQKLEGVRGKLRMLQKDFQHSQAMSQAYIKKAEQSREKLKQQELDLEELKKKAADARQAEQDEILKIDDLRDQRRKVEFETGNVRKEKENLEQEIEKMHEVMKKKIANLQDEHHRSLQNLRDYQEKNRDIKLDIEDMQENVKSCDKTVGKCERELERYKKERTRCDALLKEASESLQNVNMVNIELKSQLEKEETRAQAMEDALKATSENLRKRVTEEMRLRASLEVKKQQNATALVKGKSENKKKKQKISKQLNETEKEVIRMQNEVSILQTEHQISANTIAKLEKELSKIQEKHNEEEKALLDEKNRLVPIEKQLLGEQVGLKEKIKEMEFEEEQMTQKLKDMMVSKNAMNKRIAATNINIAQLQGDLEEADIKLESGKNLNENLKKQLDEANQRIKDRKKLHDSMMEDREKVKNQLEERIQNELILNSKLATNYRKLQSEQIDIKNRLMAVYDSKVKLENSIKDHKQLVALQEKLNEALKHYYHDRGEYNKAGLNRFHAETEENSQLMVKVQGGLEKALTHISKFLKSQIDGGTSEEVHNAALKILVPTS